MNKEKAENMTIGADKPSIEAEKVIIVDWDVRDIPEHGHKVVLLVDHPKVGVIEISKARYQKKDKITDSGLWLGVDSDGNIPYNSALAHFMRHYNIPRIRQCVQLCVETVVDSNGYLIVKAY